MKSLGIILIAMGIILKIARAISDVSMGALIIIGLILFIAGSFLKTKI
jgi:hypothetical protein